MYSMYSRSTRRSWFTRYSRSTRSERRTSTYTLFKHTHVQFSRKLNYRVLQQLVDQQVNGKHMLYAILLNEMFSLLIADRQASRVRQVFREFQEKMAYQVFQVLKENVRLVKQVTSQYIRLKGTILIYFSHTGIKGAIGEPGLPGPSGLSGPPGERGLPGANGNKVNS